jgi:hypothetical protein
MDEAKVLNACPLLHEASCDDLELQRLMVKVERDFVVLTIDGTAIRGMTAATRPTIVLPLLSESQGQAPGEMTSDSLLS